MPRTAPLSALLGLALTAGACSGSSPPAELSGLWSTGAAACAAGVGVRFEADAIEAVYDRDRQILFAHPRYSTEAEGGTFRVRITYDLPALPGGARVAGARGVLVLVRRAGGIVAESHTLIDARTGAARLRFVGDPAISALALEPCGPPRQGRQGRDRA